MAHFCLKRAPFLHKNLKKWAHDTRPVFSSSVMVLNKRPVSTIDPADQAHMSSLALDWWNTSGPVKGLHTFNIIRVPFIRDSLVDITSNTPSSTCLHDKKILEVGCGAGILTEDLAKLGAQTIGIDPSKKLLDIAIEHATSNTRLLNKPTYLHTTIEEHIEHHSNEYDAVVASEVIEHIDHTQREFFIESCVRALKPGGKIFFTTLNRTRLSQLIGIFVLEGLNVVARGTHQYHKFTTPAELKYWLELNDCRIDQTRGYVYYFWANEWKWTSSQTLNYAMHATKLK